MVDSRGVTAQGRVEEGYNRLRPTREEEEQDPFRKPHVLSGQVRTCFPDPQFQDRCRPWQVSSKPCSPVSLW